MRHVVIGVIVVAGFGAGMACGSLWRGEPGVLPPEPVLEPAAAPAVVASEPEPEPEPEPVLEQPEAIEAPVRERGLMQRLTVYSSQFTRPFEFPTVTEILTLTPNEPSSAGVAFLPDAYAVPFTISFRYRMVDADMPTRWATADGLAVVVGADEAAYQANTPPGGNTLGYLPEAGGLRVSFVTFENRRLQLSGPEGVLAQQRTDLVYAPCRWRAVAITVTSSGMSVRIDGEEQLRWLGDTSTAGGRIAFMAATGAVSSCHEVTGIAVDTEIADELDDPAGGAVEF